jgi:hypothetical protein
MTNNKLYDALILPTGEPREGEKSFPVTNEAVKAFRKGKHGCMFITGGYGGFDTAERRKGITEAQETVEYLLGRGIPLEKIYYDGRSLDTVGNFTFPIVEPLVNHIQKNPSFLDFDNMEIFAQEGHMWRIRDYVTRVKQAKYFEGDIDFHYLPGEHNNGRMARVYHKGLMNALKGKEGAHEIHDFIINNHPFYEKGWYDKSPLIRKVEMALTGVGWLMK